MITHVNTYQPMFEGASVLILQSHSFGFNIHQKPVKPLDKSVHIYIYISICKRARKYTVKLSRPGYLFWGLGCISIFFNSICMHLHHLLLAGRLAHLVRFDLKSVPPQPHLPQPPTPGGTQPPPPIPKNPEPPSQPPQGGGLLSDSYP